MKHQKTLIALAVAATLNVALAQEVARTELQTIVVSATRTPNPLDKTAASVSVVTQEDFEDAQADHVSDVLKKLPNVEFGGGPRENGEIPSIRGASGASITLLVDGARQNDNTSSLKSPLFIDPYFLKQSEVLRGPVSSLYGSGGNGGVMSFTTLSAKDLLEQGKTVGGSVKAGYGSADNSHRVNARLYGASENVDGLIAVGSHNWDKIRQGGGTYLDPNDGQAKSGLIKLGFEPSSGARIELSHNFYNSDNLQVNNGQATDYRTYWASRTAIPPAVATNPTWTTEQVNVFNAKPVVQMNHVHQKQTSLNGTIGGGLESPLLKVGIYNSKLTYENDANAAANAKANKTETETNGFSLQSTKVFDTSELGQHKVTGGLDGFRDKQIAADATDYTSNTFAESNVTRDGQRNARGVFVQDEISLGKNWSITPSIRSDHYDASVKNGSFAGNSASHISPKISVAWKGDDGLMLYSNWGEGFRAPTIVELYQNLNPARSPSDAYALSNFYANPTLKPEVDQTLEFGANVERKGVINSKDVFKARFAVFNSRVSNLISNSLYRLNGTQYWITGVGNQTICDNTGMKCNWQYVNIANAERQGIEAQGVYSLEQWKLQASYSRVRVQNSDDGSNLFSPPDKLVLSVGRRIPSNDLTIFWSTTAVAAQDYDSTVLRRRPGYATHDVFATWTPNQKLRVDFGITNLFDKRYAAYQSSNAYAYTYQEGRSVKIALTGTF